LHYTIARQPPGDGVPAAEISAGLALYGQPSVHRKPLLDAGQWRNGADTLCFAPGPENGTDEQATMLHAGTIALLIIFAAIIFAAIGLAHSIWRSSRNGVIYREALRERIRPLRLDRMLARLGIDTTAYLHRQRVAEIETHMQRCRDCESHDDCDRHLAGDDTLDPHGFCANSEVLDRIRNSGPQGK